MISLPRTADRGHGGVGEGEGRDLGTCAESERAWWILAVIENEPALPSKWPQREWQRRGTSWFLQHSFWVKYILLIAVSKYQTIHSNFIFTVVAFSSRYVFFLEIKYEMVFSKMNVSVFDGTPLLCYLLVSPVQLI